MKNFEYSRPLLSIVVANYNFGRFIADAIKSVMSQGVGDKVELIICDAASTDNSVEIIKKFADGLPSNTSYYDWVRNNSSPTISTQQLTTKITWWCSEPDSGQSAAFNKGFLHARGKYLTWLNADDVMPMGALNRVISELSKYPTCEWFTANHIRFLETDKTVIQVEWGPQYYPNAFQKKNSPLIIFGPSTFFSKATYERVGRIDETLHLAMDTDLWLRFQAAGTKQRRINCYCWAFRMHDKSKTAEYEGHVHISKGPGVKLATEHLKAVNKIGYRQSVLIRWLMIIVRVFDGSFIKRYYERKRLLGRIYDVDRGCVV